jgi:bifunctional ADP-heptose synthase (sugar kinase/adenylyltransferase)
LADDSEGASSAAGDAADRFRKSIDIEARLEHVSRAHRGRRRVVIEDYDKGTLARPQRYIDVAHEHGSASWSTRSSLLAAYRGADVIKPTSRNSRMPSAVG